MKSKAIAVSVIFAAMLFFSCFSTAGTAGEQGITVTNTSFVSMTADCISFDVTIRERGTDVDKLTDQGNIKANHVKAILKDLGIEDVVTRQFSVTPYYAYSIVDPARSVYDTNNEKKEYRYHQYVHTLGIKVEDAAARPDFAGEVIDRVLSVENAEIGNISYSISDNRKANAAVRRMSAEAVMRKIRAYADGCGVKLGSIRTMYEGMFTRDTAVTMSQAKAASNNLYGLEEMALMDAAAGAYEEDASTQISSDKVTLSAEVDYTAKLDGSNCNTLNVRGSSQVKTDPDIADFVISVNVKGKDTATIARQGAAFVKDICTRLDGECEMTTAYFSVSPFFAGEKSSSSAYHSDRANVLEYYEYAHNLRISVRDFDKDNKLGRIIDSVKKDGGDNISISGISYRLSDNSLYTAEARKGAAANGKEKCEIYASGAGTKCTGVFSIRENSSTADTEIDGDELYYGGPGKKTYRGADIADGRTVIFPDRVSVRAQLTVTAEI